LNERPRVVVVCALADELAGFACRPGMRVLTCGVGSVEAAAATARALAGGDVDVVINAGIAGVFPGRGNVGEAFIVAEELYADFGLEDGAPLTLPGGATLVHQVRASAALIEAGRRTALPLARGLTVNAITTTDATARRLREAYACDVESMEGFAVLRAAELARVPAIEVRGISNIVGDRTRAQWDFRAGSRAAVEALRSLLAVIAPAREDLAPR